MPDTFCVLPRRQWLWLALALALGASLMLPGWLSCVWFDDQRCESNKVVKTLGLIAMVWLALAGADWTRRCLPDVPQQTPRSLALQVTGLTLISVFDLDQRVTGQRIHTELRDDPPTARTRLAALIELMRAMHATSAGLTLHASSAARLPSFSLRWPLPPAQTPETPEIPETPETPETH